MYLAPYFNKALVSFQPNTVDRILTKLNDVLAYYDKKHWRDNRLLFTGVVVFDFVFGDETLRRLYTRHTYIVRDILRQVGRLYLQYDDKGLFDNDRDRFCHLPTSIVMTAILWELGDRAKDREPTTVGRELYHIEQLMSLFDLDDDARFYVRKWANRHLRTYIQSNGLYSCGKPFEVMIAKR